MQSLHSVTAEWPAILRPSPQVSLLKGCHHGDHNSDCAVSFPSGIAKWPGISRLKASWLWDHISYAVSPTISLLSILPFQDSFSKYNSTILRSSALGDLNNHVVSSSTAAPLICTLWFQDGLLSKTTDSWDLCPKGHNTMQSSLPMFIPKWPLQGIIVKTLKKWLIW